jgi:hypothetical protein
MDKKALDKVAKLIPLLASDKEGEVLGAVAAIRRVLAAGGMDLHDVAKLVLGTPVTVNVYGSSAGATPQGENASFWEAYKKYQERGPFDPQDHDIWGKRKKKYEGYKEPEPDKPSRGKYRSALDPDDLEKVNYCLEAIDILASGEYEFLKGLQVQEFPITMAQDSWLYSIHRRVKRTRDNRAAEEEVKGPKKPFVYKERDASRRR